LNGSGHSPQKLNLDHLREQGITGPSIPLRDLNAVTVPGKFPCKLCRSQIQGIAGAAAAWVDTIEGFGSGNVTIADVFEPAIRLAEEGYAPSPFTTSLTNFGHARVPVSEINSHAVSEDEPRSFSLAELLIFQQILVAAVRGSDKACISEWR
jgi:gamma-glutamyltranspeptidase/glutathione hydrolase